jgi:hypothetical protein
MSNTINMRVKLFNKVCFGTVAATLVVAGITLGAESANALTLNGGFIMTGTVDTNPGASPVLKFKDFVISAKNGDFAALTGTPVIADLALTDPGVLNDAPINTSTYQHNAVVNFITGLNLGGGLSFDLDGSPFNLYGFITNPDKFSIGGPITGVFKQGGTSLGTGTIGVNNTNGVSSIAITAADKIPTPALLPGILGMGAVAWRKRQSKTATA